METTLARTARRPVHEPAALSEIVNSRPYNLRVPVLRSVARAPAFGPAAVAAATRLSLFFVTDAHPSRRVPGDAAQYNLLARHFVAGYIHPQHGSLFDLSLLWPPGYPAFTAAVYAVSGQAVTHVILVQLVLSVATVVLTYVLAERLVGRQPATLAALILALDPISITMSSVYESEVLFATLWVVAALAWARSLQKGSAWSAGLAGSLLGLSVLVRAIALYLPVLLVPVTFFLAFGSRSRRALVTGALLFAFAIPAGLWLARNAAETGVATISTTQGINLKEYRAADALAIDSGISMDEARLILDAQVARRTHPGMNAAQVSQVQASVALRTLLHHPKGAVLSTIEGFGRVLFGPGRAELLRLVRGYISPRNTADDALLFTEAGLLFATLALALVGIIALIRARNWLPLACTLVFAVYGILLASGAEGDARFRMPTMPFIAVLAGIGGIRLFHAWQYRRVRRQGRKKSMSLTPRF
jgi:4-amino-4-deoxy-L-arabinose transferase-like glycosyltransferase